MVGFPCWNITFSTKYELTTSHFVHSTTTLITLDPSCHILIPVLFDEFFSVIQHKMFYIRNVKALHTSKMSPYEYSKEKHMDWILFRNGCLTSQVR